MRLIGETSTPKENKEWYSYKMQTGTTEGGGDSHWANAMTEDGSMWVWIPRYTYKITSGESTSGPGTIDIKFSNGVVDDINNGYKLHPAFTFGNRQVSGIWVAKFEMSGETNKVASLPGNVTTSESIKLVSKPNVSSWRGIIVSNMFTNSLNYNTTLNSHMMKNIEWGCAAYLAHSKYGRNGTEITINNNNSNMTGYGGDTISAASTANTGIAANQWTGTYGKLASTTGNIYGIYDMSGGAWECVAGYLNNSNVSSNGCNTSMLSADVKYKDIYQIGETDIQIDNYNKSSSKYGDGIYETSSSYSGSTSWNNDYSYFLSLNHAVFARGGYCSNGLNAGVFCFSNSTGNVDNNNGFRVVCIP